MPYRMPAKVSPGKLDLFREFRDEYVAPKAPALIRVRPAKYLAVEGHGAPGSAAFQAQLSALYSVAFTVKFQEKARGRDFRMLMLEGIYDLPEAPAPGKTAVPMRWTLLLRMPNSLRPAAVRTAIRTLRAKGKPANVENVRLRWMREGRSVQLLHVGPYAAEHPTLERMAEFASGQHLRLSGPHHEIYLSDPRRVPETRLKTILRQTAVAVA